MARLGNEPVSGLYYEILGPRGGVPLLFIHGGGATGACWRATPDGRTGWADQLAEQGHECWVTDWPGGGRSGGRDPLEVEYADVVDGYRRLLREVIGRPVVVVCHSMGGAVTWELVQRDSDLVAGVVSVAGAYPANVAPRSEIVADDGDVIDVVFADTGVPFRVDRRRTYLYEDAYIYNQAIATSTRFPMDAVPAMRAGLVGLPPRMLLQRLGVMPGMPVVDDPAGFEGMPVRLLAGGEDPAHTHEIETRTLEQLRSWGANAELVWLPDLGIEGNAHFLMSEENSDEILGVLTGLLNDVAGTAGR
jgi:pimeloyl-ACP methyl ester carboxylesterase